MALTRASAPAVARAAGVWIAIGTAALCLLTAGGSMTTTDAVVAFDLTQSLVERHSIASSRDLIGNDAYRGVDGRYYSPFGIAQSVWNVPFYAAGRLLAGHVSRPETAASIPKAVVTLGTIPAVALLAWCAFDLLLVLGTSPTRASDAAMLLVFATPLWPYSGFGFNQPLTALFLWTAVLCATHARRGNRTAAALCGLLAGLAALTRHEMFLAVPFLLAYASPARMWIKNAVAFAAGLAPMAAAWGAYNWLRFGSALESGYLRDRVPGLGTSFAGGAAGLLLSSYSSVFVYCPLVVLSLAGLTALWRRDRATALFFLSLFGAFFLLYSSLANWMGGRSYGPRYLVPLLPALVLPLAYWRPTSRVSRAIAVVVITLSIAVQLPGVLVDYSKVRVALARAGETVAQDLRWSRAPLLLNTRAAIDVVPPAMAALAGFQPVARVAAGTANLNEALASSPDLWWNSLLCLGVIGRGVAAAIAGVTAGRGPVLAQTRTTPRAGFRARRRASDCMKTLVALIVLGWLPGAAAFHLPVADPEQRRQLPAEERLFWAIVISCAISLTIVLLLAAGHRYSIGRLLTADALIGVALGTAAWLGRRRSGATSPPSPWPGPGALIPVALAVFAAIHFSPPSEYIIGGKDPGVYINAGVQIAQRGTLAYHDPVVAAVPAFARDLFLPKDQIRPGFVAPRFMGFFVLDPDTGTVVSQFPHLFPASVAIGHGIAGLNGARWAVTVWAVLGVLAVYFLTSRLFGRTAATATALLLIVNVVEVWFARYPNTEVAMQTLLFAALLANARAHVDGDSFFAPVAGLLLGLLLFLRVDALVPLVGIAAALGLSLVIGRRIRWTFVLPLAVAAALLVPYAMGPLHEYFARPIAFVHQLSGLDWVLAAAAVIVLAALVVAGRRWRALASAVEHWTPVAFIVVLLVAAVYAYAFRRPVQGSLADFDAYALRSFVGFYLLLPAFLAGLAGLVLTRPHFWRDPFFFMAFGAVCLFTFYKIAHRPRAFLGGAAVRGDDRCRARLLLVSGAALAAARPPALQAGGPRSDRTRVRRRCSPVCTRAARNRCVDHVEYQGIIPHLEQLAGRVGDDDLLIVESRDAGSDVHVLALPLAYIYARNVLVLSTPAPDKPTFARFLDQCARAVRTVSLPRRRRDRSAVVALVACTPIASERFQVPEYESALERAIRAACSSKEFDYSVYAFGAADSWAGWTGRSRRRHQRRHQRAPLPRQGDDADGRTFRWSQRQSFVIVQPHRRGRSDAGAVDERRRPAADASRRAVVQVLISDRPLGIDPGRHRVQASTTWRFRPTSPRPPRRRASRCGSR